jgi:uncharacterized protein (TIRG00374 family)
MKKSIWISLAAGIVLSVLGFYFAFRNVPAASLIKSMAGIDYKWLVAGAGVGFFSFVVRALRWQAILGASKNLSFGAVYHPTVIAFMINTILPGRVGELVRPAILKKKNQVPFALGLTTVIAERMLDMITLIALFAWVMAVVHIDPGLEISFQGRELDREVLERIAQKISMLCVMLTIVLSIFSVPAVQRCLKAALLSAPGFFFGKRQRLAEKIYLKISIPLGLMIDHAGSGLILVRRPVRLVLCLIYSFIIWLMQAAAIYLATFAFPAVGLDFFQAMAVFLIICFFIILPSVPGFWGIWEAGSVFGMALFGVKKDIAAGFSLVSHAMLLFPILIAGMVSLVITGVKISAAAYTDSETQQG